MGKANKKNEILQKHTMKRYILISLILIAAASAMAQSHISDLIVTPPFSGGTIKWYTEASGANQITDPAETALVNGTTYYASQTVNGVESTARLAVTATVTATPAAPTAGTHVAAQTQIDWNWEAVTGATAYKWNTTNNYGSATDLTTNRTVTQTGLTCGQSHTIYVWAYNANCNSSATTLTQSTSACLSEIAGGASSVCIGSTTQAFTNATAGGAWTISSGDSYASIDSNGIVTGLNPGSATVAYTLSGNTVTAAITVNALPNPTLTNLNGYISIGAQVRYITESGKSGYVWTFSGILDTDYTIISGGTSSDYDVIFKYLTSGSKTVTINYMANGCTAATATSLTVDVPVVDNNQ